MSHKELTTVPDDNPVWDVYDLQRTARLNVKYYTQRLSQIERDNFLLELIVAITAPSSAVAGLFFWDTEVGKDVWQYLGVLAAFFAVLKPLLKLSDKIKKFEESLTGYKTLDYDLQIIAAQIKQKKEYTQGLQKEFNRALDRKGKLAKVEPVRKENKKLKNKLQREVCSEFPSNHFYIPQG
jgi:hypothetical protein